jgi:hypothetical protein
VTTQSKPDTAAEKWVQPDWMAPYVEHLTNTGGWITPEHAMNCKGAASGCDSFSNAIRATLCCSVQSQVLLLLRLHKHGLLKG